MGRTAGNIDVDVTLLTGFGSERSFIDEILSWYAPRTPDPVAFALRNRVLLVQATSGVGIDIALAGMPFEESAVERSTAFEYAPGIVLSTASAEDLIVMKAFAARPKDWVDLEGILIRQSGRLDWHYVETHLRPLVKLKEEPAILGRLTTMREQLGG